MQYNQINNTELKISPLTLGTWVFGGKFWGGANEAHCMEAVSACIDRGVNCIDTAPIYGNGTSEITVGKALIGRRKNIILATKCGLVMKGKEIVHELSGESVVKECEDSLKRLKTDYIDLYQCHWPDENTNIAETMEAFLKLKKQGKIRAIGLSNYTQEQMEEACRYADVVTSQNSYSLLDQSAENLLRNMLRNKKIGLLAYGPLAGGILTGKYKDNPEFKGADCRKFFYKHYEGDSFKKVQNFVEKLRSLKRPLNELALNWVRQQEGVTSVLVGCRNVSQVEKNVKALDWTLTQQELDRINLILNREQ